MDQWSEEGGVNGLQRRRQGPHHYTGFFTWNDGVKDTVNSASAPARISACVADGERVGRGVAETG